MKYRPLMINLMLSVVSIVLTVFFLEVAIRGIKGQWFSAENNIIRQLDWMHSAYPVIPDPLFGWSPKPGASSGKALWVSKRVIILESGLRSTGMKRPLKLRPLILTAGDSFTFGDEVSDHETWPASLERMSGYTVLNGGVFGYGLDQIVLRAEALVAKYSPDFLIVSFMPEDIYRCELSIFRNVAKPYFEIKEGKLVLKNNLSPSVPYRMHDLDLLRRLLGYSFLAHTIMIRLNPGYWLFGRQVESARVHSQGLEVARLLLERLSKFSRERHLKTILVIQNNKVVLSRRAEEMNRLLSQTNLDSLVVLNFIPLLVSLRENQPKEFRKFFLKAHLSPYGNEWTARHIFNRILELQKD